MNETVKLWLPTEQKTRSAGKSLAYTLYEKPLTIFLTGDLGAGKTTFLQGFAEELGILGPLTSPTYALEQHYVTRRSVPFVHIDLYRLSSADSEHLLRQTDNHEGIRCVEWADRLETIPKIPHILVELAEKDAGRGLSVTFRDVAVPTDADIDAWRKEVALPQNVVDHCETVGRVAHDLATHLLTQGTIIRLDAVTKAARLHDLLRFLDFGSGGSPDGAKNVDPHAEAAWESVRRTYPGMKHEEAVSMFLHDRGFDALSAIVRTHGLHQEHTPDSRIEEVLLFYSDKRAAHDRVVTLGERFEDLAVRYGNRFQKNFVGSKAVETRLFPDGPPF